jgi:exosortase/archaeosortase family protein
VTARAWPFLLRPIAVVAVVLVAFALFNDAFRQGETAAAAGLLHALGVPVGAVQVRPGSSLAVYPDTSAPFLAIVTPSCSALASLLAVAFLAMFVPPRFRRRRFAAAGCALLVVAAGNIARIAGSIAIGLASGTGSLVLFHDWVGSLFAFAYTLGGYILMLAILLPADRAPATAAARGESRTHAG